MNIKIFCDKIHILAIESYRVLQEIKKNPLWDLLPKEDTGLVINNRCD